MPDSASLRNPNATKPDSVASSQGVENRANLSAGKLYTGTVTAVSPQTRTYDVLIDNLNVQVTDCLWGGAIFSSLFGYALDTVLSVGTRVYLVANKPDFIVGCLPGSRPPDFANGLNKYRLSDDSRLNTSGFYRQSSAVGVGATPARDLVEGEIDLRNAFEVGISFLTNLVTLGAGDLAKVECSLIDDMVRIVAGNYRQHSAFGDLEIYRDGRVNCVFEGSSYEHEVHGKLSPDDPLSPLKSDREVDLSSVDSIKETGRWRFARYVGWLGDMIHEFVSDPPKALGRLASESIRSGTYHFHVGNDGHVLMQSVAEICLEKVVCIPVPIRIRRPEDPQGVKQGDFEQLESKYLKIWQGGKDNEKLHHTCFQLREYARWLSQFAGYARYLQVASGSKADFYIPSESEVGAPSPYQGEDDRQKALGETVGYRTAYACIRIMRDGSIVTMDAYGNAVVMTKDLLQISGSRNVSIEAAGDLILTSGGKTIIKSRDSMELISVMGGMTLKARAWGKMLCELGSIWLKSDAKDPKQAKPSNPGDGPEPLILPQAVLLDAPEGQAGIFSKRTLTLAAEGAPDSDDDDDITASVVLKSKRSDVRVHANRSLWLISVTGKLALVGTTLAARAQKVLIKAVSIFDVNRQLTLKPGFLSVPDLRAERISGTSSVMGPEVGAQPKPGNTIPLAPHFNHINKISGGRDPEYAPAEDTKVLDEIEDQRKTPEPFFEEGKAPKFAFEKHELPKENFESLAQQHLRLNSAEGYAEWSPGQDSLLQATRTDQKSVPYPGASPQQLQHNGGESLHEPSSKKPSEQNKQTKLQNRQTTFKYPKSST